MRAPGQLRQPRGRRTAVSSLTALVITLACAFAVTEASYAAANGHPLGFRASSVADYGSRTPLGATVVLVVGIVVAVVGVLYLLAALVPPRLSLLPLTSPDPAIAPALSRRSLQRTLSSAALAVDGVSDVRVTGKRAVRVQARTTLGHVDGLEDRIRQAVSDRVDALDPVGRVRVRVRLEQKER